MRLGKSTNAASRTSVRRRRALGALIAFAGVPISTLGVLAVFANYPTEPLPEECQVDRIVILKQDRLLEVHHGDRSIRRMRIALGREPEGAKDRQGDGRTPEGLYVIDGRNPNSRFHLSLRVSYPDACDRAQAQRLGVHPGGDIMIHGLPNRIGFIGRLHRTIDWTDGCIAVTNPEIRELWRCVSNGTPIEIYP